MYIVLVVCLCCFFWSSESFPMFGEFSPLRVGGGDVFIYFKVLWWLCWQFNKSLFTCILALDKKKWKQLIFSVVLFWQIKVPDAWEDIVGNIARSNLRSGAVAFFSGSLRTWPATWGPSIRVTPVVRPIHTFWTHWQGLSPHPVDTVLLTLP